jgi:hypothetical protein
MASRFIFKNICRCFACIKFATCLLLSLCAHAISQSGSMTGIPLQSAMSYLNTLLAQPPGPNPQQKPPPGAPSAPVTIGLTPGKPNLTMNNPGMNAFESLLSTSPPTNPPTKPPLDLCEVRMTGCHHFTQYLISTCLQSCHTRTKYHDGTRLHDFCSKRCASTAQNLASGNSSRKPSQGPVAPGNCDVRSFICATIEHQLIRSVVSFVMPDLNTLMGHKLCHFAPSLVQTTLK